MSWTALARELSPTPLCYSAEEKGAAARPLLLPLVRSESSVRAAAGVRSPTRASAPRACRSTGWPAPPSLQTSVHLETRCSSQADWQGCSTSSGPAARWASTRVLLRHAEREPGALGGRRGSGRQQAQRRLSAPRQKEAPPAGPSQLIGGHRRWEARLWRRAGAWRCAGRAPHSWLHAHRRRVRLRDRLCP